MDPRQRGHLAYLLRLWRVDNGTEAIWRASLQDVRSGERLGFASLNEAVAFLRQQQTVGECRASQEEDVTG